MPMMSGGAWLWMLATLLVVIGMVMLIASALSSSGNARDEALNILRARFARGEIDADQFANTKAALGDQPSRRRPARARLVVGIAVLVGGFLAAALAWAATGGSGWMMGSGMMGMMGPAPTAPPGTSVTMAGARFTPPTISITTGETVRWFNDDAMPHTATSLDRAWDSSNLAPGGSFERRFDHPGSYSYVCLYHAWMTGVVVVSPH